MSSGYSATFFAASKQRNRNSVQGIFMYEKFNRFPDSSHTGRGQKDPRSLEV
jgi:hypothetical protein